MLEILDQHTPPQELPVKDIVTMVATFQQERDQEEGLDRSIRGTSAAHLQHPSVMFAVLQRGRGNFESQQGRLFLSSILTNFISIPNLPPHCWIGVMMLSTPCGACMRTKHF